MKFVNPDHDPARFFKDGSAAADVRIRCLDDKIVETSSVLLSISSDYLKSMLIDAQEDDKVVLMEFPSSVVEKLISYVVSGFAAFNDESSMKELADLLLLLQFKTKFEPKKRKRKRVAVKTEEENEQPQQDLFWTNTKKTESKQRECPTCRKTFALRTWYNHKKSCERAANQDFLLCDICGFKTVHPDVLRSHHGSFHGGEKKFKCPECPKSYYKKYRLDIHIRGEHSTTYTFMCDICAKGFNRVDSLNKHKKHVHNKIYLFQCALCSEKFKNRAAISRHVIIHSDLEPFHCSACDQRFKVNAAAYTHKLKFHNNQSKVLLRGGEDLIELKRKLIKKIEPEKIETGRKFLRYKGFPTIAGVEITK